MAGGELEFFRALKHSLSDVKLIGLLIDCAELGEEAGIAESDLVSGRGDALHVADGLRVLAQLVMRADEAHPGGDVGGVGCDDLLIERGGLRKTFGLHENAGVLELGVVFESAAVAGKRQSEREIESVLGIGGAALGLIDGGESAEEFRILVEDSANAGRESRGDGKSSIALIGARIGNEKAAPAIERSWLNLDEEFVDARRQWCTAAP